MQKKENKRTTVKSGVPELRIRLLRERRKDNRGLWVYAPQFPNDWPDLRVHASSGESALRVLENVIVNELDGRDDAYEEVKPS